MTNAEKLNEILEEYAVVAHLSDKNGCETLRVRHRKLGRDMVLHLLDRRSDVYDTLCAVSCENLPQIYDVITTDDGMIVPEEYVEGLTVTQIMETGRISRGGAKKIMLGVCRALCVLHENGIIHRDVKPDNIIVTDGGRVVLADFNISRRRSAASRDTEIMGTLGYAPPEQQGSMQTDETADVYAAGVTLNVMLTGKLPEQQTAGGRLGRVVKRCISRIPRDRYQSVEKLACAIK